MTAILTRQRSDEEKARRHVFGDKGARFSGGKVPKVDLGDVIGTVTTMVTKDILLIEYEDSDEHDRGRDMPDDPRDLSQGGNVQRV